MRHLLTRSTKFAFNSISTTLTGTASLGLKRLSVLSMMSATVWMSIMLTGYRLLAYHDVQTAAKCFMAA